MKPIKESKLLTLALALVLALGVLSASIAVPILCRSFYYAQIGPLGLEEYTGLNEEVIRQAYDGVLDYCTGKTETFSAGLLQRAELTWSSGSRRTGSHPWDGRCISRRMPAASCGP